MNRLAVNFAGVALKNPVVAASGTFYYGKEYAEFFDVNRLGAIALKGITCKPKAGNTGIRIWETASGMLNSIGLENPGVEEFVRNYDCYTEALTTARIVNLGSDTLEEYVYAAERLNELSIELLELNISCPNVRSGGMAFGVDCDMAYEVTKAVRKVSRHKLIVKLSPNVTDIVAIARRCEEAGADGLSLINTVLGMAVDIKEKRAVFDNVYAGLSGAAIKPIALRMVHQVCKSVSIPVMGVGGIYTAEDALAFLMAGAACVQVGTANFIEPGRSLKIIQRLEKYCEEEDIHIGELIGVV